MARRRVLTTAAAPAAIGPYSQAIVTRDWVWTSGQIPLDPVTGELVGEDAEGQAERVLDNLAGVLGAAGCTFDDVVKTTIYLIDLADFAAVNAVYGRRFAGAPPARSTVQVAALPRGARVEIDAVACIPAELASTPRNSGEPSP